MLIRIIVAILLFSEVTGKTTPKALQHNKRSGIDSDRSDTEEINKDIKTRADEIQRDASLDKNSVFVAKLKVPSKEHGTVVPVTQMNDAPIPWVPIDPDQVHRFLAHESGPKKLGRSKNDHQDEIMNPTGPTWVFFTVESDDLMKYMNAQQSKKSLRQHEVVDIPGIVNIIKNLTSDYENVEFVNKLNKTLRNMSMPMCQEAFRSSTSKQNITFSLVYFILIFVSMFFIVFK